MFFFRKGLVIFILLSLLTGSCKTTSTPNFTQKKVVKNEKAKSKEVHKIYKKALKRHHRNQNKEVRKRLRKDYRATKKLHNEKTFFLFRWLKKHKKCY